MTLKRISIHGHRSLTNSLRPTLGVGVRQPYGVLVENLNRRQRYNLPTRITISLILCVNQKPDTHLPGSRDSIQRDLKIEIDSRSMLKDSFMMMERIIM